MGSPQPTILPVLQLSA